MPVTTVPTRVGRLVVHDEGPATQQPVVQRRAAQPRPAQPRPAPVLVFRHGIFFDHRLWARQAAHFSRSQRVLSIDSPGHGSSGDPGRAYSLDDDAQATLEVMDALGISRAVLVGHSWGGMSALRTALSSSDRVEALALVDTPLLGPTRSGRVRFRTLRAVVELAGTPRWFAERIAADMFTRRGRAERPELDENLIRSLSGLDRRAVARAMQAVLIDPGDMVERMSQLTVPVLVAAGAEDYVLPPAVAERVRRALPASTISVVPGGHVIPLESADATTDLLSDFVESLR
ncbi:MAG: hypothetical protein RI885_2033 [Actinomycetota bacterium]